MRMTFLGSSHGVPEPNRQCACTMLEIDGNVYFIDMGMMAINALITRGIDIDAVKAIFITHPHGDHTNGLPGFVDILTWKFKTADPLIHLPDMEMAEAIAGWLKVVGSGSRPIRYAEVKPGLLFDDGKLKVTAYATQHCPKSHAYLVEAEGKAFLFTGDLKHPSVDFPEVIKERKIDLVICEAAHFSPEEYIPVFKDADISRVCIHHHAPRNYPGVHKFAEMMGDVPVTTVYDGLEINY